MKACLGSLYARSVAVHDRLQRQPALLVNFWIVLASAACGLRLSFAPAGGVDGLAAGLWMAVPYALLVGLPALLLWYALANCEGPPAPGRNLMLTGRWRQVDPLTAARHPLYGPTGLMVSLMLGILLNVPMRTAEFLVSMPPLVGEVPPWYRVLFTLVFADVVLLASLYIVCFAAALRRHPLFPRLLMAAWLFDFFTQRAIRSAMRGISGTPEDVIASLHALLEGNSTRVLISMVLWGPYLLFSRRVNVTYRHLVRN